MSDESIFAGAIAIPDPAAREEFLDEACAGNPQLREEVEALLAAHAAQNPLDRPLDVETVIQSSSDEVGTVIAERYKLLEQIGEGGMGTVWVAEQFEPVRRKVAIKLIKAGMDSRSVLARFEAERQALAMMDHPHIAKVLDGGLTESGRPFFVMEYVKGVPITEYCDEARLSVTERLDLFLQVCAAVQHAHQKGIIHRDLKPSNVLVAPYDDKPVPKVIDFGLAKAMNQALTNRTLHTAHEMVLGTPLYMSPEQAQLNNLDVDTRTDIYALGVLLYELLTGTTPFEKESFKTAAWDEVRRIIREVDPPRPSLRLSSTQTLPSVAACRHTEPVKLTQLIRGDLDWIVMKALEKDRKRRYETANGLARDIERYLSDELVEARPPSTSYRLLKYYRRNRGQVIGAGLLLATLLLGIFGTTYGLIRADKSRQQAQQQAYFAHQKEKEATAAAEEANLERDKTTNALEAEQAALKSLDRLKYVWSIQLAYQNFRDGNMAVAVPLLDESPPEFRDWEWHYLHRLCNKDLRTLKVSNDHLFSAKFSRDGSKILTADEVGEIKVWDARSGALLKSFPYKSVVMFAEFSPDESQIFAGYYFLNRREWRVWDVRSGKFEEITEPDLGHHSSAIDVTRGKLQIITTHDDKNGASIKVWDPGSSVWEQVLLLEGENEDSHLVLPEFSPDSSRLIAVSRNRKKNTSEFIVWDTNTREVIYRFPVTDGRAYKPRWSPDGSLLALPSETSGTRIVDAKTGETIHILEDTKDLYTGDFSPNGKRLLSCTSDEVVTIWDLETGKALKQLNGHTDTVRSAEFSPDGNRVVTASQDGTVKIWDAKANHEPLFLAETRKENTRVCPAPAFSPDNSRIAYSNEAVLKVCDATDAKILQELRPLESRIRGLQFFPDGQRILIDLSVSYRDTIKLIVLNLTTLERRDIQVDAVPTLRAAILSPDGRFIAVMDYEFHVNLLEADTGKLVRRLDGHTGQVFSMSFSQDSNRIVTSGDKTARVWDVHTGKELARFEGHGQSGERFNVWSVGFSPDGTRVVSLASRNTIVWDAQTGEQSLALQSFAEGYRGAELKYSPNGKRILVSNDVGVSIFDAESGHHLLNLRSTTRNISRNVAVSPDGTRIAFSTKEGVEIHDSGPFPHSALANP